MKIWLQIFLSVICTMIILSLFVLLYGYTGIHVPNQTGSTDYKWESHQFKSTMTEGFSWTRLDRNGFNNPDAQMASLDILIMGSSHMEALNVGKQESTAACMRALLPEWSIYNIGTSGHTIYRCANNLKHAVDEYHPKQYVIIETDNVLLDGEQMNAVLNDELAPIPSYNSGLLYGIQKYCPAIKTIYKNIEEWKAADHKTKLDDKEEMTCDEALLVSFLKKMRLDCGERKLIIVYHPETGIDGNGRLNQSSNGIEMFSYVCEQNDIYFVDMTEDFEKLFKEQQILAHGFINTAVGTGHLNKYGHRCIAERITEVIKEDGQK